MVGVLGHVMRRGESNTVKSVIYWKPLGKRLRGRPRKRWIDVVEGDLRKIGIDMRRAMVNDGGGWQRVLRVTRRRRRRRNWVIGTLFIV